MNEVGRFYVAKSRHKDDYLSLRWKGRVRYTVPRDQAAQQECWKVFRPGLLGIPLRAMASLPRLPAVKACAEGPQIELMRRAIGSAGLSACRAGAAGPWQKDTILFLDQRSTGPLYFVKAGTGAEVDSLLKNEAHWLDSLRDDPELRDHLPELIAHHSGDELCFIAQSPLTGETIFEFGDTHIAFLQKLQSQSRRSIKFEDSKLHKNLSARMTFLTALLSPEWQERLNTAVHQIEESLSGLTLNFVTAHNDFTPWNIRVNAGLAQVFDWEYADIEQLPLFDPLHFALHPMALKRQPAETMAMKIREVTQRFRSYAERDLSDHAESQSLAYAVNLCSLYLFAERGKSDGNEMLKVFGRLIDHLCAVRVH